jgi:hypothetical protein
LPAYVEPDVNPAYTPFDAQQARELGLAPLSPQNRELGRGFRIVAFRWLTQDEI